MRSLSSTRVIGYVLAVTSLAGTANAQTASRSSAVASPTYVSLHLEVTVNKAAADVWKQFGGYCSVAAWMKAPCTIVSGKDGELGAVRSIAGGEVLVGRTPLSYTYTQPVKDGRPYNLYHGTFEVRPMAATTSTIIYEFVFDNSMLPDDAARELDKTQKTTLFMQRLERMKVFLDTGTMPPAQ